MWWFSGSKLFPMPKACCLGTKHHISEKMVPILLSTIGQSFFILLLKHCLDEGTTDSLLNELSLLVTLKA